MTWRDFACWWPWLDVYRQRARPLYIRFHWPGVLPAALKRAVLEFQLTNLRN